MEELDLKELLNMFWNRRAQIRIIIAIFLVLGLLYSFIYVKPDYKANTTIILAQSSTSEDTTNTITTSDLTLNQKLVSTYTELIKSKTILGDVIRNLSIDRTEDSLKNSITVSAVKDTDLIKISVTDSNPETAKRIAEEVASVFMERVAKGVYNINNVQVWDKAETPSGPYNINHTKDIAIFLFIGIIVSCVFVLVANMLDTTIKSKEDIEKKLELTVLTVIPLYDFDTSNKSKKGGRR